MGRQQFWRRTVSRTTSEGNMSGCGPGRSAALAESTGSDFGHYDITDMSGEQPEQSNDRRYPSKCARYARHLSPVTEIRAELTLRSLLPPYLQRSRGRSADSTARATVLLLTRSRVSAQEQFSRWTLGADNVANWRGSPDPPREFGTRSAPRPLCVEDAPTAAVIAGVHPNYR